MSDVLKFPGKWHGPEQEASHNTEAAGQGINTENLITMIEALTIYMPQKIKSQELMKTYAPLVAGYTKEEIVSMINNSDLTDWQTKTVLFHCLYEDASKRGLIDRNRAI